MPLRPQRAALLESALTGQDLAAALSGQIDVAFVEAAANLPAGWALLATAGYAESMLCPGSDLDVLLLHPRKAKATDVEDVARSLWYPFWDAGLKLSPAVHTVVSALRLASDDLITATTYLRVRHLAGDVSLSAELAERAAEQWKKNAKRWLRELGQVVSERHERAGEVAFLLEPNLKEGRGGLRDVQAIEWACSTEVAGLEDGLFRTRGELATLANSLFEARTELHRSTGRSGDVLLLQDQDAVANRLGFADADRLMSMIAETARTIAWASDRFWERVEATVRRSRREERALAVGPGLAVRDGELEFAADANLDDPGIILRVAATAARLGVLPSGPTLLQLASEAAEPPRQWSEAQRDEFVELLDCGEAMVAVIEALDQYGLFARVIPEWQAVRSKPQRNAYHRYTVDRHLLMTVVRARELVRTVRRPDLLLLGAFLHDIGKGVPGDHVVTGMSISQSMCAAMAIDPAGTEILVTLVEHHLLLAETATRRDVSDPGTIDNMVRLLGDLDTLELLRALTEADSLATGPSAWSAWKEGLIDELVERTSRRFAGHPAAEVDAAMLAAHADMVEQVRSDGCLRLQADDHRCVIAAPDHRGLFAELTGVLASHGIEVVSADVWTSADGVALDEFRHVRRTGGHPDWPKVESDLRAAALGQFDIEARIERRAKSYRRTGLRTAEPARPEVLIDNDTSADATIVEVRATDALALLYRLSKLIAELGFDIRHAKVATLGHEVVDVFYVRDAFAEELTKLSAGRAKELSASVGEALVHSL